MLRAQYRCHPIISGLASRLFYGSRLFDGLGATAHAARAPLLDGLPTLGFVEVCGVEKLDRGGSFSNSTEAQRVVRLVGNLHAAGLEAPRIGVICLYSAQASLCAQLLAETGLLEEGVAVSTVDAFQGAERDVIVVTVCRTASDGQHAFIASPQRLNVTITRARHHLLLVGSARVLSAEAAWADLIGEAHPVPARFVAARVEATEEPAGEVAAAPAGNGGAADAEDAHLIAPHHQQDEGVGEPEDEELTGEADEADVLALLDF